ncbi:aromatic amino acid lyase [bacterium SCSIO 12741]|nr:aromatic amino acid lyase [bacterium SCSIO 12741]
MIEIGGRPLTMHDFNRILFHDEKVGISEEGRLKVQKSFDFLDSFSDDKVIYGINTGFGPMAQYRINDEDRITLQYNLIRSHASGVGQPLKPSYAKATMVARLNTLAQGYSGVHVSALEVLCELINRDVIPLIFEHGGVGASGDLVQLAHLALVMIGEGEVFYEGKRRPTAEVFEELNIAPLKVRRREGLAIMNGTSCMTGIGIINVLMARKILRLGVEASCLINELVGTYDDHYSKELNRAKHHKGQRRVADLMSNYLADSQMVKSRKEHLYSGDHEEEVFEEKVQEYYSLRCVPQILGPVLDTISFSKKVLIEEVNSGNDNPIIDVEKQNVFHGGNFHGDYVSLEMDKLKIAVTKLTMLAERQLNFILNARLNDILPPFVNLGKLGFNFGMQGVQFTAVSTTAESQMLSNPMYVHSISNNNDNQDIVSMGTNAALITSKVIENAFEVMSIHFMSLLQAVEILDCKTRLSSTSQNVYEEIRALFPNFSDDHPKYDQVRAVKEYLMQKEI